MSISALMLLLPLSSSHFKETILCVSAIIRVRVICILPTRALATSMTLRQLIELICWTALQQGTRWLFTSLLAHSHLSRAHVKK